MKNYIKKTLKNGVKLYLYLDKNMKQCYVDYMIKYGSSGIWYDFYLDDKLYHVEPGCAHFLEHMLGEHSKYGDFYKYMTTKKYNKNGMTSDRITHYFFKGTIDVLDSLEKLINVVDAPVFTKEDVEETKHAIIEETKRGINNKYRTLYALVLRNLYKDIDLFTDTLSAIGDEKSTKRINYDMLKTCYDAFYYDENKVLLVAGNFDEKEITDYIENIYSKLKPHKKRVKDCTYNFDGIKKKHDMTVRSTFDDLFGIGFKEQIKNNTKNEITYYMEFVINNMFSEYSDFVIRLKEQNILVSTSSFINRFISDKDYFFYIDATVKNKEKFEEELIKEFKTRKYNKKDFDLFIRSQISFEALKIDKKYDVFSIFSYRLNYDDNFSDIKLLKKLKFEDFQKFYKSLDFDDYVVGVITNK